MTTLEAILDGLDAELALERELGVRTVEIDRALLKPLDAPAPAPAKPEPAPEPAPEKPAPVASPKPPPAAVVPPKPAPPRPATGAALDFVFLHDRPLSAEGREMMDKIAVALGRTSETAPVLVEPPAPESRIRVVLGFTALRKWYPGRHGEPGTWFTDEEGREVLITYTPVYILRFKVMTPALKKLKLAMWASLKSILQHLRNQGAGHA